ncbi:MAG: ATP-binding protein [Candidatus Eremiobacteraeota bacterium]|nr:ATP-binding protein [Candidatus Eremiobacteraeota bacterium]
MPAYSDVPLWQRALGARIDDSCEQERGHLRVAFQRFRERASQLAAEIPINLSSYTVHDITHLDALWGLASQIAGDEILLTPPEAFVLGGAFLCHDLGMSASAYVGGLTDVEASPLWSEALKCLGLTATPELSHEEYSDAVAWVLRENHAAQGAKLPTQGWSERGTGEKVYLIDETDLRRAFGSLIGRLAESHWFDFDRVVGELSKVYGAALDFPQSWTIDALKLAALLRLADAAHVDQRRAPTFLRVIRGISGISELHWLFQERINQPRRVGDRLEYTSSAPLTRDMADAWWIAYDAVASIDAELASVDAYCSANPNGFRFAARGVVGAGNATALSRYIEADGWLPFDARPKISDVGAMIGRFGGEDLYGTSPITSVRELLQNALDAVYALRAIRGATLQSDRVRVDFDSRALVLRVTDFGVGMSMDTIRNALLDFGTSGWRPDILRRDLPALLQTNFKASGRYGIGFFSVFMLGSKVTVRTRRYDAAAEDTLVLTFSDGIARRPLLRKADPDERMLTSGTMVEIVLKETSEKTLLRAWGEDENRPASALATVIVNLVPGARVPVDLGVDGICSEVLNGVSLEDCTESEFVRRITDRSTIKPVIADFENIYDVDGTWLGRAALSARDEEMGSAVDGILVTEGGVTTGFVGSIVGVLLAEPARAIRDFATPVGHPEAYAAWATTQAVKLKSLKLGPSQEMQASSVAMMLGANVGELLVCETSEGYLTENEFLRWCNGRDEVLLLMDDHLDDARGTRYKSFSITLDANVAVIRSIYALITQEEPSHARRMRWWPKPKDGESGAENPVPWFMQVAAASWDVPVSAVREASLGLVFSRGDERVVREVGRLEGDGTAIEEMVVVLTRPSGVSGS